MIIPIIRGREGGRGLENDDDYRNVSFLWKYYHSFRFIKWWYCHKGAVINYHRGGRLGIYDPPPIRRVWNLWPAPILTSRISRRWKIMNTPNTDFSVLLWQKICQSSHAILVHYSGCEDSEVSRSTTPIELHQIRLLHPNVCLLLQGAVIMHDSGF